MGLRSRLLDSILGSNAYNVIAMTFTTSVAATHLGRLALIVIVGIPGALSAQTPARISIADSGRSLTSDGKGPYIPGELGVIAGVDAAGDFAFSLASNSGRAFNLDLSSPVDSANAPYRGVFRCDASEHSDILVHDILSIPVGGTALRNGHIQLEIRYVNGRAPMAYFQSFNTHENDPVALFSVTRTSSSQWVVENARGPDGDVSSFRWYSLPPDPNRMAWTYLGHAHYHTPLRMTITIAPAP